MASSGGLSKSKTARSDGGGVPAPRVLGVTALCGWWYLALVWVWGGVEEGALRLSLRFRTIEISIRTWLESIKGPSRRTRALLIYCQGSRFESHIVCQQASLANVFFLASGLLLHSGFLPLIFKPGGCC